MQAGRQGALHAMQKQPWLLASISGAEPLMEHCSGCCLHPALVSSAHCTCASHMLHLSTARITVMHVQVMLLRPC